MRIFDFFCNHTLSGIDGYAIIHGEQKITWRDMARQVLALQVSLGKDYKKGDRILLMTDDPLWQIIGLLGASAAGLASILTDSSMPTSQKESIFRSESIQGVVNPRNIPAIPLFDFPESSIPWAPGVAESDLFLGALSSGSTGIPKIIWRDHQSWTRAFPVQQEIFQMGQKDTLFLAGSLLYTANMNSALQILHAGGTLVLAEAPWPRSWIREIKEKQVTGIFMVPANYRLLLQQGERIGNTQVRSLVSAGEKMDRATMKKLQSIFPKAQITEYYGASELGHVSYAQNEEIAEVQGSVGRPFPGVRISIEEGKIWVESPYLAPAYRPRATIHDLGRMDQAGYLYLDGREGSLINAGGIKIIPGQLEDLLLQYEGIKEAVVVGVPDKLRGQKAVAFIVPQWDSLSRKKIQNHLRERLPKHLWPHQFVFLDCLPRNTAGKADRKALAGLDIQEFPQELEDSKMNQENEKALSGCGCAGGCGGKTQEKQEMLIEANLPGKEDMVEEAWETLVRTLTPFGWDLVLTPGEPEGVFICGSPVVVSEGTEMQATDIVKTALAIANGEIPAESSGCCGGKNHKSE